MSGKPDQRSTDHGRHARRPWRAVFDSALPIIIACLIVTLAVLSVLSVGVWTNARNAKKAALKARVAATTAKAAIRRSVLTSRNGCQRVQLLRDDQNVTSWGVYVVLNQQQTSDPAKMTKMFARLDPETRAVLLALIQAGGQSRKLMNRVRDEQRYSPPTNCARASKNPAYRFPKPIPFARVAKCYRPASKEDVRLGRHPDRIKAGQCPR